MSGHSHHIPTDPPAKLVLPGNFNAIALGSAGLGALIFVIGLFAVDPLRAWKSYLIGLTFFVMLSMFGPFLICTQYLTRAGWSTTLRRIPESFAWGLPVAGVLSLPFIIAGAPTVYEWLDPHLMKTDVLIMKKAPYLNQPFMIGRQIFAFVAMSAVAIIMVKNSYKQDEDGDKKHHYTNGRLASIFLVVMSLGITFVSVDHIMSLHPHWFSTMWAVNYWITMFQGGIAVMTIIALWLVRRGDLKGYVNDNHIHDIGKLTFAATPFWAYIAFCQFLLIWYANLPEEAIFYNARMGNGWATWTAVLPIVKFIIPFFLMLPRSVKRGKFLMPICFWLVGATFLELYWWVAPAPAPGVHHVAPSFPWMEFGVFVGFAGLFAFIAGKFLSSHALIPIKDPRLEETFHHHQ